MALVIENTTEKLTKLSRALKNRAGLNQVTSSSVAILIRNHFRAIGERQKNKFKSPPRFWKRMVKSVKPLFSSTSAAVEMARPIAQRYFGGPIKPTGTKRYLTIPVNKIAYNKKAAFFHDDDMFVYTSNLGNKFLAISQKKKKKRVLTLLYLLKERVNQLGDKSTLPTTSEINSAMENALSIHLREKME